MNGIDEGFVEFMAEQAGYQSAMWDMVRRGGKSRAEVKKRAENGDAVCRDVMVLWDGHVREMRRLHAGKR